MEIKGAITMTNDEGRETRDEGRETRDDLRYYLACPLRKNHARIPVTVCHKQKCLWLTSDGGKVKCGYGPACAKASAGRDPNLKPGGRPKVKKIERDGVL